LEAIKPIFWAPLLKTWRFTLLELAGQKVLLYFFPNLFWPCRVWVNSIGPPSLGDFPLRRFTTPFGVRGFETRFLSSFGLRNPLEVSLCD